MIILTIHTLSYNLEELIYIRLTKFDAFFSFSYQPNRA